MAGPGTVWQKASAVRTLVRANVNGSCGTLANAYWRLGLNVGLKVRRLQLSANGANGYDTHETTEVWLPGLHLWSVSDPTFDGWWSDSLAPQGTFPISARLVQYRVRNGQADALRWHQGGSVVLPPWLYYLDIRYAFRVLDYELFVVGRNAKSYVVDDPVDVASAGTYRTAANLSLASPATALPVSPIQVADPPQAAADLPLDPPPYAESLRTSIAVTVPASGAGSWEVPGSPSRAGFVVVRGSGGGTWTLRTGTVYPLTALAANAVLSPIAFWSHARPLEVAGATPGSTFTIQAWDAGRFPAPP